MLKIKEADYRQISRDYRGILDGKRTVFAGCILPRGGTRMAVEGVDFEIIPTPKTAPRQWRRRAA
jgi:hypothetical protein